jgi:hypothetical protein
MYDQKLMPHEIWGSFWEALLLIRVKEVPRTSTQNILAAEGVEVPFISRILHEQSLCPYYIQRLKPLIPPDHCARLVFCQWFLAKCFANIQFVANIILLIRWD